MTHATFSINFDTEYFELHTPPRCRKPRYRILTGKVTTEIPELAAADAPVAIISTYPAALRSMPVHRDRGNRRRVDYRWYQGRLYTTVRKLRFCCYDNKEKKIGERFATTDNIPWRYYRYGADISEHQANFAAAMSRYVLVDGVLHEEIGEPRYVCMTFGLGHNHGGTALMVDHYYNSNIVTDAYFSVLEEAEARDAALSIAAGRGDTKDVPGIRKRYYQRFQVLIPEAVKLDRATREGGVDEFSATLNAITNSGMPMVMTGIAVMAQVFR